MTARVKQVREENIFQRLWNFPLVPNATSDQIEQWAEDQIIHRMKILILLAIYNAALPLLGYALSVLFR